MNASADDLLWQASNLGNPISSIETRSAPALLGATHRAFTLLSRKSHFLDFLIKYLCELRGEIEIVSARSPLQRPAISVASVYPWFSFFD